MQILINLKLLTYLLVAIALVGVGVYLLHGYQESRNTAGLLRQAEHARDQGKLPRAAQLYYRYLLAVPSDNDVRVDYGELLEKMALSSPDPAVKGQLQWQALAVFDDVLLRDPGRQ